MYYSFAICAVVLVVISQLLFVKASNDNIDTSVTKLYVNKFTFWGYSFMLLATVLNAYALKNLPIKILVFFSPISYVLVPIFAHLIFHQELDKNKKLGIAIIFFGIMIFNYQ